jgi:hypothetical protein
MTSRRTRVMVASGIAVAGVLVAGAWWSGRMDPFARRPILDGLTAPVAYRWVHPPPELAAGNQQPTRARFNVPLGPNGSSATALNTSDVQCTLVLNKGVIAPSHGQSSALITIEARDPADFPSPPSGLAATGNVYELAATYRPSGRPVPAFDPAGRAILIYPAIPTIHAEGHELLYSATGKDWSTRPTSDIVARQQVEGTIPGPGPVLVAGRPMAATPSGGPSTPSSLPVIIAVVAGCILLISLGLLAALMRRDRS